MSAKVIERLKPYFKPRPRQRHRHPHRRRAATPPASAPGAPATPAGSAPAAPGRDARRRPPAARRRPPPPPAAAHRRSAAAPAQPSRRSRAAAFAGARQKAKAAATAPAAAAAPADHAGVQAPQAPPGGTPPAPDNAMLVGRREQLARLYAELQSDLGGLVYEMAVRDQFRLDLVARQAAKLQAVDVELTRGRAGARARDERSGVEVSVVRQPRPVNAAYCGRCGAPLARSLHELTARRGPAAAAAAPAPRPRRPPPRRPPPAAAPPAPPSTPAPAPAPPPAPGGTTPPTACARARRSAAAAPPSQPTPAAIRAGR